MEVKELLYILWLIIRNFATTLTLSLLLPFHSFLGCFFPAFPADSVAFYEGIVWHERRRPIHHSFRYRVRYALFHLDCFPHALANHLSADEARALAGTRGAVSLLTIPPSVGYVQSPLSVYYCYDLEDSESVLKKCIAEVTNSPWGERISFVFNPSSDLVAKALHLSPFMDMLGSWKMKASVPGDDLSVSIVVQHPHLGEYFSASLRAKKVPSTMVPHHTLYFWLMPHTAALQIYWNVVKLRWKGVSVVRHPRHSNPAYREEASLRDQKLNCCKAGSLGVTGSCLRDDENKEARRFIWTNAKWPWAK